MTVAGQTLAPQTQMPQQIPRQAMSTQATSMPQQMYQQMPCQAMTMPQQMPQQALSMPQQMNQQFPVTFAPAAPVPYGTMQASPWSTAPQSLPRPAAARASSTVYPNPVEWWECTFLVPHEAIRQMAKDGNEILATMDVEKHPWKAKLWHSWYLETYCKFVEAHHKAEEEIFFPWLESKVKFQERAASDHKKLLIYLAKVKELSIQLKNSPSNALVAQIRPLFAQFQAEMLPHLAEEEVIAGKMAKVFTKEECDCTIAKLVAYDLKLGIGDLVLKVLWHQLQTWGTPAQIAQFFEELPFPVRMLLKYIWYPSFLKTELQWVKDLKGSVRPAPAKGFCGCMSPQVD